MTTALPPSARRPSVDELLGLLCDAPLRSWDAPAGPPPPHADTPAYRDILRRASARAGHDEAVRTGEGLIAGRRVAIVAGDFAFLGGSIGIRAAERIVAAVERATARRLPLLGITASGGTRMQEGTPAFLYMPAIAEALAEHARAGLCYLTYLRQPTTGGTLASWGSLGQLTFAEPGALVGFLGPKVYAALRGTEFPPGVQTAEHLQRHALVDSVVAPEELRHTVGRVFDLLLPTVAGPGATPAAVGAAAAAEPGAWEAVLTTRDPRRPGLRALLGQAGDFLTLGAAPPAGTPGALLALARFGPTSCVLVGHDRDDPRPPGPGAPRLVRRAARLAASLRLPLVTVIDTAGSELSVAAEEGGTAREIARCLAALATVETPTVSVLLGQGAGGAALALLPADRVIAARHAWLTPLPPEGASAILHGTPDRAAEVAEDQRIRAADLERHGAVDVIINDIPDDVFPCATARAIEAQLHLASTDTAPGWRARRRAGRINQRR